MDDRYSDDPALLRFRLSLLRLVARGSDEVARLEELLSRLEPPAPRSRIA